MIGPLLSIARPSRAGVVYFARRCWIACLRVCHCRLSRGRCCRGRTRPDLPSMIPGPEGATVRHLLAHASGLPLRCASCRRSRQAPHLLQRGLDILMRSWLARSGMGAAQWCARRRLTCLEWVPRCPGSPAHAGAASAADVSLSAEPARPTLVSAPPPAPRGTLTASGARRRRARLWAFHALPVGPPAWKFVARRLRH